jgi:hypothetical protein
MIWIDVHPIGENPTNVTYTLPTLVHVCPVYTFCRWSLYVVTFHQSSTGLNGCTALEKKCSRLHLSVRLSGLCDPPQFFSQHSHWSSALTPSTCWRQTTRLTRLISPAWDRYVQYLLTGTNHSVLNRHRRGLPHRNLGIATTFPTLPFWVFHWSLLNDSAWSLFYQILISNNSECICTYCRHMVFWSLVTYRHQYLRLVNSNDL